MICCYREGQSKFVGMSLEMRQHDSLEFKTRNTTHSRDTRFHQTADLAISAMNCIA